MLTKITSKNQITVPKKIIDQLPGVQYFDLQIKEGIVLLKPVKIYDTSLEQIRSKMKKLGLRSDSVREAIKWVRSK